MNMCYSVKPIISFFLYFTYIKYSIRPLPYIIVLSCDQLCPFLHQLSQELLGFPQNPPRVGYK